MVSNGVWNVKYFWIVKSWGILVVVMS